MTAYLLHLAVLAGIYIILTISLLGSGNWPDTFDGYKCV